MKDTKKALFWIVAILRKYRIPFQISGGLAARLYGSERKLADIDIDVPRKTLLKVLPDVRRYIIFGPARYKDQNWDLNMITLRYCGQEIDLCGIEGAKIFYKRLKKWVPYRTDLSKAIRRRLYNLSVPVISRKELIRYKTKLARRVCLEDVRQIMRKLYIK